MTIFVFFIKQFGKLYGVFSFYFIRLYLYCWDFVYVNMFMYNVQNSCFKLTKSCFYHVFDFSAIQYFHLNESNICWCQYLHRSILARITYGFWAYVKFFCSLFHNKIGWWRIIINIIQALFLFFGIRTLLNQKFNHRTVFAFKHCRAN